MSAATGVLEYARVARVHMEDIVDDDLDLPSKLSGNVKYESIKSRPIIRRPR